MLDRTEQVIAYAVREVFDGHCGTGARVDPERPSWEQVGREVVAGLAAAGGVVVWRDASVAPSGEWPMACRDCRVILPAARMFWHYQRGCILRAERLAYVEEARRVEAARLASLSPVSAETTESETT